MFSTNTMNEKQKFLEAKYFYKGMIETETSREHFSYNLSAFLSAARTVLQYALEETKLKRGGQAWHDKFIANSNVFRFFIDKRNVNIHEEPVPLKAQHNISINETIHISDSIHIKMIDKQGKVISEYHSPDSAKKKPEQDSSSVSSKTVYKFDDWMGSEDVLLLSEKYILELDSFLSEGISKGFIAG